jgi:hypothetical protein
VAVIAPSSATETNDLAACAEDAADRGPSALYGVLAGVDAVGLDLPEVRQLTRTANHQNQATADRRDGY